MNYPTASKHEHLCELAALYALDALEGSELAGYEAHLRTCTACEREVRSLREVSCALGAATPAEPPARLRSKLLSRVATAPPSPGILLESSGLLISRSAELAWMPLASGIDYKPLFIDEQRKYSTMLVRMEAGAHYPSHHHRDVEELFMLSGDLHVAGEIMRSGDYCRAALDTIHGETYSETGCLFLLLASQENQIVA